MIATPPHRRAVLAAVLIAGAFAIGGCTPHRPPPPSRSFAGLPVSGTLADARAAGFVHCVSDPISMRCRRSGVTIAGQGPYEAAVDLVGSDGNGGFDLLTLWSDHGEMAILDAGDALERRGWRSCITGHDDVGDQQVYTHPHVPLIASMDISYYAHRRLRLIPMAANFKRPC